MLIANRKGNYSFLRGIAPYSGGTLADDEYEIVHVRFSRPIPLSLGFDRIKEHLAAISRPVHALCAMELRSPRPFTFQGFNDFNAAYIQVLSRWGIFTDNVNPIARTNVAPELHAPTSPSLYGFSYTIPSHTKVKTFVVAGGGELPEGSLDPHDVIRRGETSSDAVQQKAEFVMTLMTARLKALGVNWDAATAVNVYTVHPICGIISDSIVRPIGASALHGVTWHYSRPPIVSIEYEMDVRASQHELVLS